MDWAQFLTSRQSSANVKAQTLSLGGDRGIIKQKQLVNHCAYNCDAENYLKPVSTKLCNLMSANLAFESSDMPSSLEDNVISIVAIMAGFHSWLHRFQCALSTFVTVHRSHMAMNSQSNSATKRQNDMYTIKNTCVTKNEKRISPSWKSLSSITFVTCYLESRCLALFHCKASFVPAYKLQHSVVEKFTIQFNHNTSSATTLNSPTWWF